MPIQTVLDDPSGIIMQIVTVSLITREVIKAQKDLYHQGRAWSCLPASGTRCLAVERHFWLLAGHPDAGINKV